MSQVRKRHQDICPSYDYSDLSQSSKARQKDVCHGEDQVKAAMGLGVFAAISMCVAYVAYVVIEDLYLPSAGYSR